MRESRDLKAEQRIPIAEKASIEKPAEKKLTLGEIANSVALAVLRSKALIDLESAKVKKEVYDRDEILKNVPLTTFDISDVEVELKFLVGGVEKDDVVVNADPETLTRAQNVVSSIKLRLTSKKLSEYTLEGKERVIR